MRLRWTLLSGTSAESVDVEVTAPHGTALAAVWGPAAAAGGLVGRLGAVGASGGCWVAGQAVPAEQLLGAAPLLDGAVLTVRATTDPGTTATSPSGTAAASTTATGAAGVTHVRLVSVSGPDSGRTHHLRPGLLTLGRGPACDLVLADPDVSRHHASVRVDTDGVRVLDTGSTNGTRVRHDPGETHALLTSEDQPLLRLGSALLLGGSTLRVEAGELPGRRRGTPTGYGTVEVPRPPRACEPERSRVFRLPAPPTPTRGPRRIPWLTTLLPLVAAGVLAAVTGYLLFLVLAVLGPVLVAANAFTDRREHRSEDGRSRQQHQDSTARVGAEAHAAARLLAAARRSSLPDAATLLRRAGGADTRLWERSGSDGDLMRVRIGTRSSTAVATTDATAAGPVGLPHPQHPQHPATVVLEHPDGTQEPVTTTDDLLSLDLGAGAAAIVEGGPDVGLARFVLGQLCAAVSPDDLGVVALVAGDAAERWQWLRWLPHTRPEATDLPDDGSVTVAVTPQAVRKRVAQLTDLVVVRRADRPSPGRGPRRVVVLLDDVLDLPDGCSVGALVGASDVGVHLLVVARDARDLPAGCHSVVRPHGEAGSAVSLQVGSRPPEVAVADRVGGWWAERLARLLAPLRPASRDSTGAAVTERQLPASVPLAGLLGGAGAEDTLRRWSSADDGLAVPLGVSGTGTQLVDLVANGPHALVAGTTGAGKSELLRTWVSAMAACFPPEKVTFLLVDYKGGAAFGECAALPHTVQLLTDLDGAATSRVLQSLRAEVRRREELLARCGAKDLLAYRAPGDRAAAMPRLVVVVDEFRILAEEAPQVLGELVNIAATGRSLGIHLVLATQRPAGVVSADIRANASLRIALRVRDPAESVDVVDRPDAAGLPSARPGRAILVGSGVDAVMQSALTAQVVPSGKVLVRRWSPTDAGSATSTARAAPGAGAGQESAGDEADDGWSEVMLGVLEAARRSGRPQASPPWLAPLPEVFRHPAAGGTGAWDDLADPRATTGPALLVGCADLPGSQTRRGLWWHPADDGPVLVVGGPRTGRSTTLSTVAASARAAGLPVLVIAHPGRAVGRGPGLVDPGDIDHLLDTLVALQARVRAVGAGGSEDTGLVVCVDDVDTLLDPAGDPDVAEALATLVREGGRGRVWPVLAGGRALAVSRLAAGVRLRLQHRPSEPGEASLLGADRRSLPAVMPPGRAVALGWELGDQGAQGPAPGTVEVQVLHPGDGVRQHDALPGWLPAPLAGLVSRQDMPTPRWDALPIGLGAGGGVAVVDAAATTLLVVAGPPGSGRTTTLKTLVAQARQAGVQITSVDPALACGPQGPHVLARLRRLARQDVPRQETAGNRPDLVVVDDVDRCPEPVREAVEDLLHRPRTDLAVAVATTPDHLSSSFRGIASHARLHGSGILLQPGRTDARDVFGLRGAARQGSRAPGRGLLVGGGRAARLQVSVPGLDPSH